MPTGQEQDSGPDLSDLLRDKLTEAKVAQARAEASLAAQELVIAELRAQLAGHRLPWRRRLIG